MVIGEIPIISEDLRNCIGEIVEAEFRAIEHDVNIMLKWPPGNYAHTWDYRCSYISGKNNIVLDHQDKPVMSSFEFRLRAQIKLYHLLGITSKPIINAIRVYPNMLVPMHIDQNRGGIGREYPIYSIVVSGSDGCIYMSSKVDGTWEIAIPGLTQFVMCPTLICHGARSGNEPYTLFQIQLKNTENIVI